MGCDGNTVSVKSNNLFLLTHPVWDVTFRAPVKLSGRMTFLLTHPVWDVTTTIFAPSSLVIFLLTHPVWDVTKGLQKGEQSPTISTHTSRVGCDLEKR